MVTGIFDRCKAQGAGIAPCARCIASCAGIAPCARCIASWPAPLALRLGCPESGLGLTLLNERPLTGIFSPYGAKSRHRQFALGAVTQF